MYIRVKVREYFTLHILPTPKGGNERQTHMGYSNKTLPLEYDDDNE